MRICRSFKLKVPTNEEYSFFVKKHHSSLWRRVPETWTCPACGRHKIEIMRWKAGSWKGSLHRHHDHGLRWEGKYIICGDCNSADGIAKKHLCLPSDWSFTPDELREFVRCEPYGSIASIDLDTALAIYMEENLSLIAQDFVGEKIQGNTM